jgi:glucosylceramidase
MLGRMFDLARQRVFHRAAAALLACYASLGFGQVLHFTTVADRSLLFACTNVAFEAARGATGEVLRIDASAKFQTLEGFGAALTGSSCFNLLKMSPERREALLRETFDRKQGMGWSYVRISLGCSDFSLSEYTYCDKPGLENFALTGEELSYVIPVLLEANAVNPKLKVVASPWTCPRWMKVNNLKELRPYDRWAGGQLNPACYRDYAEYFVKFIAAMKAEGIAVNAVTIQNEPLNRGNSVSLYMGWEEQRDFIKTALGPAFRKAGVDAKIWVFDHNFNYDGIASQQRYPLKIYEDAEAAQYVDGAAYHAYGGGPAELDVIRLARPDKGIYFTEMSIGAWNYSFAGDLMWASQNLALGTLSRGCRAVIVWNFMLDENSAPKRPGGCQNCYGAVDVSSKDYATLDRKSYYYLISHLAKVLHPGATRIGAAGALPPQVEAVAAENPNGTLGLFVRNGDKRAHAVTVDDGAHAFTLELPARSVHSAIWRK